MPTSSPGLSWLEIQIWVERLQRWSRGRLGSGRSRQPKGIEVSSGVAGINGSVRDGRRSPTRFRQSVLPQDVPVRGIDRVDQAAEAAPDVQHAIRDRGLLADIGAEV